jgi:predicted nucleotidyltransferase
VKLPDDFRDLLVHLTDAGADFIVVGGHAVARHGHVRATKDIDVLVRPDADNATRVMQALATFGAPLRALGVDLADFSRPGQVVQLGVPPLRIDVITSISGVSYEEAVIDPDTLDVDGRPVRVIGLEALLKNKRASGRAQDLADVDALERVRSKTRRS